MNHKLSKLLIIGLGVCLAIFAINFSQTQSVEAAPYYRGAKVSTPSSIRGTWYGYNYQNKLSKMKITAHTVTLPYVLRGYPHGTYTLYYQNKSIYNVAGKKGEKYINAANKYASKHRWMSTWKYNYKGHKWIGIDPFWLDLGDNDFGGGLRATTVTKNGRNVKQLILNNPNSTKYFYQSATLAKQMR